MVKQINLKKIGKPNFMKKLIISLSCFCFFVSLSTAQDFKFEVSISSDTVLMDNHFELRFSVENAKQGNFEGPAFENFDLVGGPNYSSSMTIINGDMSQSTTYTYFLKPITPGDYTLGPAFFNSKEGQQASPTINIYVKENPDGIQQDLNGFSTSRSNSANSVNKLKKQKEDKLKKYKLKKL